MNYKFIFTCLLLTACFSLQAQNEKLRIAIFDPTSSGTTIDEGTKMAVREIISSVFVNTGKYTIVERSMIERVMQEQKFSTSGAVDDSQASEIGKLLGVNKIVLSVITLAGKRNMLSIKLVDVNTASVEKQKIQVITAKELLGTTEPLTLELIGEDASSVRQIELFFAGDPTDKNNPSAQIYIKGTLVGSGSLQKGFKVFFPDKNPGKHKIEIKWSDKKKSDVYKIDTKKRKIFNFRKNKKNIKIIS